MCNANGRAGTCLDPAAAVDRVAEVANVDEPHADADAADHLHTIAKHDFMLCYALPCCWSRVRHLLRVLVQYTEYSNLCTRREHNIMWLEDNVRRSVNSVLADYSIQVFVTDTRLLEPTHVIVLASWTWTRRGGARRTLTLLTSSDVNTAQHTHTHKSSLQTGQDRAAPENNARRAEPIRRG